VGFRRVFYIAVTPKWDIDAVAVAVAFYRARMQIRDASPRKFVRPRKPSYVPIGIKKKKIIMSILKSMLFFMSRDTLASRE
jgi:hypothetical protein